MATRFRVASGKAAIWDGHTDLLPFNTPLSYLDRVKFHTDLDYVQIIDTRTFTLNIPAISSSGSGQGTGGRRGLRTATYTLGNHGRPGQPFVIGEISVNGTPVTFTGSVPVHQLASASPYIDAYARWLALGVTTTSVVIHEYAVQAGDASAGTWAPRPAQSFPITVYITDILL